MAENKVLYFDYNNKVTTDFITLDNIKAVIKSYSPSDNYFNKLVDFGVENEILTVSFNADNEIAGTYIAAFDFNKHFIGYSKINKNKISLFRDDRKIEISAEISPAASNICLLRDIR